MNDSSLDLDTPSSVDAAAVRKLSKTISVSQVWLGAILLILWPLFNALRPTNFPWQATLHALSAVGIVVLGGYAGHHAIYLLRGVSQRIPAVRRLILWCVGLSGITIVTGNWAYMPYRGEGGARQRLLASAPFFHTVLMEFKEFICLLPLPLYAGAAFLLWYYGKQTTPDNRIAPVIGVLLIAAWTALITGAVVGISIAQVQFL
jgi:hypothetical protein